jgi:pimeloyl-ACP methyl ester carboxylesterase
VKTLLIWGEQDHEVPLRIAEEMKRIIRFSELKVIENAGHNTYLDKPDLFFGYVKKYISNI